MNHAFTMISEAVCPLNHPAAWGATYIWPAVLCHFLCSNFYFYPLDMIPIVSRQPQRLNGLIKPPLRTRLCSRLGGGGLGEVFLRYPGTFQPFFYHID